MMVSPPSGNWLLGLGPTWLFPTATRDELDDSSGGSVRPLSSVIAPRNGLPASSHSTLGESEVGMVKARPTPAISACSISSSTTCPIPGRLVLTRRSVTITAPLRKQVECPGWTLCVEDDQVREYTGQAPAWHGVLGDKTGGLRQVAQIKLNIIPVISPLVKNSLFGK